MGPFTRARVRILYFSSRPESLGPQRGAGAMMRGSRCVEAIAGLREETIHDRRSRLSRRQRACGASPSSSSRSAARRARPALRGTRATARPSRSPEWIARAGRALSNHKENFPLFLTAVIVVHLVHANDRTSALAAIVYVIARAAHGLLYIAGVKAVRSLAFITGTGAVLTILSRLWSERRSGREREGASARSRARRRCSDAVADGRAGLAAAAVLHALLVACRIGAAR